MFERSKTETWEQTGDFLKCTGHNWEMVIRMEQENMDAFKKCSQITIIKTQVLIE